MVTQYGIKYAVNLITAHFGDLVAKVCECLLRKGPLTLQAIVRSTELTSSQVKNSLLVLIQHNCVQAFILDQTGEHGDGAKQSTQYIALLDNIIQRWRFPKFLTVVSKKLDKQCAELLEGLLQHGRLTLKQMFDRAKSGQNGGKSFRIPCLLSVSWIYTKVSLLDDVVQEAFVKLLNAHFIERCPASEPVLTNPTKEEEAARKRVAKSGKVFFDSILEVQETLEQRVVEAAMPTEALRFLFATETEPTADGGKDKSNSSSVTPGEKRKHDALESEAECGATDEQVACIENVRARFDDGAVIVFGAMLEATRSAEKKVKTENSVPLSLSSIYEEVIKSEEGRNITFDRVRASLVQLSCPPFVKAANESYSVDFKKIIELAQHEEVESIVLKRYGRDAYRMFRLLSNSGHLLETDKGCKRAGFEQIEQTYVFVHEVESIVLKRYGRDAYRMFRLLSNSGHLLETDKVADATFVEKKETPIILYKLWKDDYLQLEKLQIGVKQIPFQLWKVNKNTLKVHVLDEMFHAAFNLSQRVAFELEQEKELSNVLQDKCVNRLRKRLLLESSQMKLDDAIMLFHDF
ncbi:hypothetical protein GOBAR_AA28824 [Gossypium barbadense]|uniref:DNA-directed RNA polymerase III subunit RPC3 n=1 Tax=Gossypium barbadense TaxID=3634 RepID=A0A2P5WL95_GOSBA|nr:hypothetical protein GOBAR_AA28824 [Gossypium barbadense]